MKPDFTLSLSTETIQLLHRNDRGWTLIGEAKVADPNLAGAMSALRARALGLGNGKPFGTKILIPNEQIRFLALDTTRATEDDVRQGLDGATPYPVSELVYDFVTGGGRTYIAAVSRRTLTEAEGFATAHEMAPLCFCASPVPFTFLGEVFFGPTRASRDILPFGTFLDRDPEPVIVTARMDGEDGPGEAVAPRTVPPPLLRQIAVTAASPDQHGAVLVDPDAGPDPDDEAAPAGDGSDALAASGLPAAPETPPEETPETAAAKGPSPLPAPAPAGTVFAAATAGFASRRAPTVPPRSEPPVRATEPRPGAAGADTAGPSPVTGFQSRRTETEPPLAAPAGPAAAPPPKQGGSGSGGGPAFATRRDPTDPPRAAHGPARAGDGPPDRPAPASISALDPPPDLTVVGAPLPTEMPDITKVGTPLPAPERPADPDRTVLGAQLPGAALKVPQPGENGGRAAPTLVTSGTLPGVSAPSLRADPRPAQAESARGDDGEAEGGGFFSRRRAARAAAAATGAAEAPQAVAGSVFGTSRRPGPRRREVGGKPRFLGLILTILLLVFMAAVAAYAALTEEGLARFFNRGAAQPADVAAVPAEAAESAPDLGLAPAPQQPLAALPETPGAALPGAPPAPAPPRPPAEALAGAASADAVPGFDPESPAPDRAAPPPPSGRVLSPDEAERAYAATGVWQRAPRLPILPRAGTIGAFGPSEPAAAVARPALPGLPDAGSLRSDLSFIAPPPPPPAGVVYPRDARGFILATPEGTVLPDGSVVYAGRPPVEPPARPGTEPPPPLVAEDGLVVIAGRPPVTPPVRPAPEAADVPDTPNSPDTPEIAEAPPPAASEADPAAPAPAPGAAAETLAAELPDAAPESATGPSDPGALASGAGAATEPLATEAVAPAAEDAIGEGLVVIDGAPPVEPPARPEPEAPVVTVAAAPDGRAVLSASDGLLVLSGAPALRPPARAATAVPVPAETGAAPETAEDAGAEATRAANDLSAAGSAEVTEPPLAPGAVALAAFRPVARPDSLDVPPGVLLEPDPTLAGFRPRARPADLAPAAPDPAAAPAAPPDEDASASAALAAAIASAVSAAEAAAPQIVDATAQAVTASARPDARPRNFARVVEQARRNEARLAQRQQQRQQQQQAQREADEADAEPEPVAAAPSSGPTAQSVAAAATDQNAINLRQISLIGVYGNPSNRRALVRLGNGRFVKVSLGDRLDGGRVAAIGESYLDYTQRGRTYRLEMPRG